LKLKTAELFGKLANIFADLPSKSIDDNGMFKSITGEDYMTVEKKNKTPFSFKPYAKLLFSCNEIPKNYGDRSSAFYRRLIIIRFNKSVPLKMRDVNLMEKFTMEADGILMWALKGLERLIKNDFVFSETEKTRLEVERYRIDSNSVLSFAKEYCTFGENNFIELKELYGKYKEYCMESGLNPSSQIKFGRELKENYENLTTYKDSLSRRTVYKGISFSEY
jgi:putative DNA primase/helicase